MKHFPHYLLVVLLLIGFAAMAQADQASDKKVQALLDRVAAAATKANTLAADIVVTRRENTKTKIWRGTAKLLKPNYARIELKQEFPRDKEGWALPDLSVSDGHHLWIVFKAGQRVHYRKQRVGSRGGGIGPIQSFFGHWRVNRGHEWRYMGKAKATVGGKKFDVVEFHTIQQWPSTRLYIGSDGLVNRMRRVSKDASEAETVELRNIRTGVKLKATDFKYKLPANATELKMLTR